MYNLKCKFCGILLVTAIFLETCPTCMGGKLVPEEKYAKDPHVPAPEWRGQAHFWRGSLSGFESTVTATPVAVEAVTISMSGNVDQRILKEISRQIEINLQNRKEESQTIEKQTNNT